MVNTNHSCSTNTAEQLYWNGLCEDQCFVWFMASICQGFFPLPAAIMMAYWCTNKKQKKLAHEGFWELPNCLNGKYVAISLCKKKKKKKKKKNSYINNDKPKTHT